MTKKVVILLMVLAVFSASIFVGNMVGNNTPKAEAMTVSDVEFCMVLNIYLDPKKNDPQVDVAGFLECLAVMNSL